MDEEILGNQETFKSDEILEFGFPGKQVNVKVLENSI